MTGRILASLDVLSRLSARLWRPTLVLAAVVFAVSGPLHAAGYTDAVFYAALAGLTLAGAAVPLGLLALRVPESTGTIHEQTTREQTG